VGAVRDRNHRDAAAVAGAQQLALDVHAHLRVAAGGVVIAMPPPVCFA
jgi:hypothetical protein